MSDFLKSLSLKILNDGIRKRSFITRALFGVRILRDRRIHWDFTTLALKSCLMHHVRRESRVLEIGTGPYAILSIFLSKRTGADITACDINQSYVDHAVRNAAVNGAAIRVLQSDLFCNIQGTYDTIFFNSIYIPRSVGIRHGINTYHEEESEWCGGETGIETIKKFLENAPFHLREHGEILLGFNPGYLPEESVDREYRACGYRVKARYLKVCNPSIVLVLERNEK